MLSSVPRAFNRTFPCARDFSQLRREPTKPRAWFLKIILATAICLCVGTTSLAEGIDDAESEESNWKFTSSDVPYRVVFFSKSTREPHGGNQCERLQVIANPGGTYVHLAHDVAPSALIDELSFSVWVRADQPGIEFRARVVLPETKDPATGRSMVRLLPGSSSSKPGEWEELRMGDFVRHLSRLEQVLNLEKVPGVSMRNAYIDQVVINLYGTNGDVTLSIDDLNGKGMVAAADTAIDTQADPLNSDGGSHESQEGSDESNSSSGESSPGSRFQFSGNVLTFDDRPIVPRIIVHRGEPLGLLRNLGFTAALVSKVPDRELLEEAKQAGLWLIAPPPSSEELNGSGASPRRETYPAVMAWNLGSALADGELEQVRQLSDQLRQWDGYPPRPLMCDPDTELRAYCRAADVLLSTRFPVGTRLEYADYAAWLQQRARLARPGTPWWATIQSQVASEIIAQRSAYLGQDQEPLPLESEQIRALAYAAISAGAKGLLFDSQSPLDATDDATSLRALTFELLNTELDLLEPWIAASNWVDTVGSTDGSIQGAVLQTRHSRILLPSWIGKSTQYAVGQAASNNVSFVVPGVPDSHDAFLVTPGGLRPLKHQRTQGGMRVTVDEMGPSALIFITQDVAAMGQLTKKLQSTGQRAANAQRSLAALEFRNAENLLRSVATSSKPSQQYRNWMSSSANSLRTADTRIANRDFANAFLEADRSMRGSRLVRRALWEEAARSLGSPVSSPFAASTFTLAEQWQFLREIGATRWSANQLADGEFEQISAMIQSGWQHHRFPIDGIESSAELSPQAPKSGRSSLRLAVTAQDQETGPELVESVPLWITSPPVSVIAGSRIRIHGYVRIPKKIQGSVDGLIIFDSIGGLSSAEIFRGPGDWQEFTLFRVAPEDTDVSITVALTGLGEAFVDKIALDVAEGAVPRDELNQSRPGYRQ